MSLFSSAFELTQNEANDRTEATEDDQTDHDQLLVEDDDNELTKPYSQRQQLMKTARRYQTRKTQQKPPDSLIRSHSFGHSASMSISHRLQTVSREYRKQSTLTRSRSNTATSMKDDNDGADVNVPYHTIIIDCAPITFVDSMGTRALYQVTN